MGGVLAQLTAADLATAVLAELVRRTGLGEGDVDDVVLGQRLRQRRVTGDRPGGRARRRPGHRRARPADRPTLRFRPAGGAVRRRAGRHRGGPAGGRRRRGVDVERRALRARPAHRRQAGRHRADGPPRPRPRDRGRRVTPGARRHDRDGGEPPRGLRHLPRSAGRAGGALPSPRGRRARGGQVRRRTRAGHRPRQARQARHRRRPRRASPRPTRPSRVSARCARSGSSSIRTPR